MTKCAWCNGSNLVPEGEVPPPSGTTRACPDCGGRNYFEFASILADIDGVVTRQLPTATMQTNEGGLAWDHFGTSKIISNVEMSRAIQGIITDKRRKT